MSLPHRILALLSTTVAALQLPSTIDSYSMSTTYLSAKPHRLFSLPYIRHQGNRIALTGWVERDGEWEWEEDDPNYVPPPAATATTLSTVATTATNVATTTATATPTLPTGSYRPKQSLGQNFLRDGNTVLKILRAFAEDAVDRDVDAPIVELGPGAGALTDQLVALYGADQLHCIEIDDRSVELLRNKHGDSLVVDHADVLQVNYPKLAAQYGSSGSSSSPSLTVIGNLPYYITSQILFALADASHQGAVRSATVTMQWEVGQRMVAPTHCKDYGILSVVFQLYANVKLHFKIPPTVFYPQPKVDSALLGLHFLGPVDLSKRLAGVRPVDVRRVVTATFQQRRKTVRNSLKKLCKELYGTRRIILSTTNNEDCETNMDDEKDWVQSILTSEPLPLPEIVQQAVEDGDEFALKQALPLDWASKRPEELSPGQFVELTRLVFQRVTTGETVDGSAEQPSQELGNKVWRKLKHGTN